MFLAISNLVASPAEVRSDVGCSMFELVREIIGHSSAIALKALHGCQVLVFLLNNQLLFHSNIYNYKKMITSSGTIKINLMINSVIGWTFFLSLGLGKC